MALDITPARVVAELRSAGFVILPLPNVLGRVDGFHASRFGVGYVDCIIVRSETFAIVARVRDQFDPEDPLREPEVVWSAIGTLETVVVELREMYRPVRCHPSRRTRACAPDPMMEEHQQEDADG